MSGKYRLICEAPLLINIQNKPYSIVMRMPGDEVFHAAGFCLSDGIISTPEDIIDLFYDDAFPEKGVNVLLKNRRYEKIAPLIEMKRPVVQTGYGVCVKGMVDKVCEMSGFFNNLHDREVATKHERQIRHIKNRKIDMERAEHCVIHLSDHQPVRGKTRAAHASAVIDSNYNFIWTFEDVGRHNALDKVIGKAFLENRLKDIFFLVLSSRISYELVQKAARAGISAICAVSRPTDLAVKIARKLNMTIACLSKDHGMDIFSGESCQNL